MFTNKEMMTALKDGKLFADWQEEQLNPITNSYESCIFVRIGRVEENRWERFFGDEIDVLPEEVRQLADDTYEESLDS